MSLRLIHAASPLACNGVGDRMGKNDSESCGLLEPSSFNRWKILYKNIRGPKLFEPFI